MKILFLTSGPGVPSTRYRMMPFVRQLRARGHRCIVASSRPEKYEYYRSIGWRMSKRLQRAVRRWHLLLARLWRPDVIVIERELFDDEGSDYEQRFRRLNAGLVLDVDDAIFLRHREKFDQLARMADVVIAGNDGLKAVIEPLNSSVVVIPTCLELDAYQVRAAASDSSGPVVLGWIGTSSNLKQLEVAAPVLRDVAINHDVAIRVVTNHDVQLSDFDFTGVPIQFVPWSPATAVAEIRKFDVGLMPLHDTEWNRYKCGFKILQYMATGIPAVASPVGANAQIIQDGVNGFLPKSHEEWRDVLVRIVAEPLLRQRIGSEGRRTVEERYSVDRYVDAFISSLEAARRRARGQEEQESS